MDLDDYAAIDDCDAAGSPLPPICEVLDFDRDNDVDKDDANLFYQCCYTGGSTPEGGSNALAGMVDWAQETMSPAERGTHADSVFEASLNAGEEEAAVLQNYADTIDPL